MGIDNGVCWTGKPDPACEMADCHNKSYMWYSYTDFVNYVECFECNRHTMCQNNCAGHEQPIHAPTHDPNDHQDHNDHQDGVVFDTTGCCTCPPEYDGHQAWIDNGVCWTGKPDPACEMADCHNKSYMWYSYTDFVNYVECFECNRHKMCQNNCAGHEQPIHAPTHDPNDHQDHNDHQDGVVFDTTGCCTCPPEYDGHQAWIDNGVC